MKQRKTRQEKIKSQERVARNQLEYARLLKQKVDLREYKEALLMNQENVRRNFVLLELCFGTIIISALSGIKKLDNFYSNTHYPKKKVIIENDSITSLDLGYAKKDEKLKDSVFYYQSSWLANQGDLFAIRYHVTIKNKKELLAYLQSLQETNQIKLPDETVATITYETARFDEIDLAEKSEFYAEYEIIDKKTKVEIPMTEEERKEVDKKLSILFAALGIYLSATLYEIGSLPYKSDMQELKKRIRALEENQE